MEVLKVKADFKKPSSGSIVRFGGEEFTKTLLYMSEIEIIFFTARILQNQRMLFCGECFHE
jgi:hypothetical protein